MKTPKIEEISHWLGENMNIELNAWQQTQLASKDPTSAFGPRRCGKTTLLLLRAIYHASHGRQVLVVGRNSRHVHALRTQAKGLVADAPAGSFLHCLKDANIDNMFWQRLLRFGLPKEIKRLTREEDYVARVVLIDDIDDYNQEFWKTGEGNHLTGMVERQEVNYLAVSGTV
jgi:ABC-type taurine transport system ATPase subunit